MVTQPFFLGEFNVFLNGSGDTVNARVAGTGQGVLAVSLQRDGLSWLVVYDTLFGVQIPGEPNFPTLSSNSEYRPSLASLQDASHAWVYYSNTATLTLKISQEGPVGTYDTLTIAGGVGGADPGVAQLLDGNLVVMWSMPDSVDKVQYQVIDQDGGTVSSVLSLFGTGDLTDPEITALSDGRFVIAGNDASDNGNIKAWRIEADGSNPTAAALPATADADARPVVIGLAGGGAFVTAFQRSGDGSGWGIYYVVHDSTGAAAGVTTAGPQLANTVTTNNQERVAGCALADGGFVLVWADERDLISNSLDIWAQVFNSDGSKRGTEFQVAATTANENAPSVSELADGRIVFVWDDQAVGIVSAICDPRQAGVTRNGTPFEDEFMASRWADTFRGGDSNDIFVGFIFGETAEVDTFEGGNGNDIFYIGFNDTVVETGGVGGGSDTILSEVVSINLAGLPSVENAQLIGLNNLNLTGNNAANSLFGNVGQNVITGGRGRDLMGGGADAVLDTFDFNAVIEMGKAPKTRDQITDFHHLQDKIDLATIDANGTAAGSPLFKLIAAKNAAFTGVKGQLRWTQENKPGMANDKTIVHGDIDGNKIADFQVELKGLIVLSSADFNL